MLPFKKSIEFLLSLMSDDYNQVGKTSLEIITAYHSKGAGCSLYIYRIDVLKFIDWLGIKI